MRAGAVTGEVNAEGGLIVDGQEVIDSSGNMTLEGDLVLSGTVSLPKTTLSELPEATESNQGQLLFLTDEDAVYYSDGSQWSPLAGGGGVANEPLFHSASPSQIEPNQDVTVTINGQNFKDGCEVEINGNLSSVTFVNAGQITIDTGTELESGVYSIRITNPNGIRLTEGSGLIVDALPVWVSSEDLGRVIDSVTGDHLTLEATDAEGDVTYALTSGNLPTGLSLNTETGVISGDPEDVENDIEYTFEVTVSDTAPTPNLVAREFVVTVIHRLGQHPESPGLTCKDIMDSGTSEGNGLYWIDPNGDDHSDSFQAFCNIPDRDMISYHYNLPGTYMVVEGGDRPGWNVGKTGFGSNRILFKTNI